MKNIKLIKCVYVALEHKISKMKLCASTLNVVSRDDKFRF